MKLFAFCNAVSEHYLIGANIGKLTFFNDHLKRMMKICDLI